jgi:hypothetical protein
MKNKISILLIFFSFNIYANCPQNTSDSINVSVTELASCSEEEQVNLVNKIVITREQVHSDLQESKSDLEYFRSLSQRVNKKIIKLKNPNQLSGPKSAAHTRERSREVYKQYQGKLIEVKTGQIELAEIKRVLDIFEALDL